MQTKNSLTARPTRKHVCCFSFQWKNDVIRLWKKKSFISFKINMLNRFSSLTRRLSRRKTYAENEDGDLVESHSGTGPKLLRVLSLFDLTFLGIGSTLGVGIYVLAGSVAKDVAGPAVCLSFLVAAAASGISGTIY